MDSATTQYEPVNAWATPRPPRAAKYPITLGGTPYVGTTLLSVIALFFSAVRSSGAGLATATDTVLPLAAFEKPHATPA